jgi:hypothetical protein
MAEQLKRVGVREFREELSRYLDSPTPVALTRHGHTIGYCVPTWTTDRVEIYLSAES